MPDLRHRMNLPDRRGMIEAFRGIPRTAQLLRFGLQIAARHVETERIAVHIIKTLIGGNVFSLLADGRD